MKIKLILLPAFVFAAGLTFLYDCTTKEQKTNVQGPAISFTEINYNFGRVQQGNRVTHLYSFTNTGTDKLVINDVQSSCGCTAAIASSREVLPGGKGAITADFDSSNYLGPVTKTITVATNDPSKPAVTLTLTGEVVSDIVINPPILFLGSIKKGSTKEQTLNIFISNPAVKITSVTSSKSFIKLAPAAQSVSQETFIVTISPDAPLGPLNSDIKVLYAGKNAQTRSVPVIGNIVGDILVNPDLVEFGIIKRGAASAPVINVFLYTQPSRAFRITKIQTEPDVLKVKVSKQAVGSYRLELTTKQLKTTGKLSGEITVHTTMKTMPVVVIPFNGVVI